MINILLSIKNYIELYHEKKTIIFNTHFLRYLLLRFVCARPPVHSQRYVAVRLDYALHDWLIFFINNSLIRP